MATKSRFPKNKYSFLRFNSVSDGTTSDLPINTLDSIFPISVNPLDINGLEVWHSMVNVSGSDSDTVGTFPDISGNSRDATVTGTTRELVVESNGMRAIRIGSSDESCSYSLPLSTGIRTIVMLFRVTDNVTGKHTSVTGLMGDSAGDVQIFSDTSGNSPYNYQRGYECTDANASGTKSLDDIQNDLIRGSFVYDGSGEGGIVYNHKLMIFEFQEGTNAENSGTFYWGRYGVSRTSLEIADALVYSTKLTQTEKDGLYRYFFDNRKYNRVTNANHNVIFIGDGIIGGQSNSSTPFAYIANNISESCDGGTLSIDECLIVSDNNRPSITSDYTNVYKRKLGSYKGSYSGTNIIVLGVGSEDIIEGYNSTQISLATYAIIDNLLADTDAEIILCNIIDRDAPFGEQTNFDTQRGLINSAFSTYAASTSRVHLADLYGNSELQDHTDTTYFESDGIHCKAAGNDIIGATILTVIETLI